MSAVQYMILAYALYLIYSGFNNKKKLKHPNPVFPDEEVNVLFTKIDKTLKLCSSICIFLGGLIILAVFLDVFFDFKNISANCVECKKIGNFLFRGNFLIFCLSICFILLNGAQFQIAGNLSGLKEDIETYYDEQGFRKMKYWIDNTKSYSPLFAKADNMIHNMKQYLSCYPGMKAGLYLYYFSIFIFVLLHFLLLILGI